MTLQWNGAKISAKRFAVHINLPPCCSRQLAGIPQLLKPLSPDVKEVAEGGGNAPRSLNVDDPGIIVCVEPVEARIVRCNPNVCGNGSLYPTHVHRHMCMNVRAGLLCTLTGNVIYRRVRSVGRCVALRNHEIDKDSNSEHAYRDDADGCNTLRSSGTPSLFFAPSLFLAALFLPRVVTSALLAHTFHFPFVCAFQVSLSIVQHVAGHHNNWLMVAICGCVGRAFTRQTFQDSLYYL